MDTYKYTDENIKKILDQHKKKREREQKKYHQVLKHDEEWRKNNCAKSREHYEQNKDQYKVKYLSNKEYIKIRNLYRYYLRENKVNDFKMKFPQKYEYLQNKGYVKIDDNKPIKQINEWFIPKECEENVGGLE